LKHSPVSERLSCHEKLIHGGNLGIKLIESGPCNNPADHDPFPADQSLLTRRQKLALPRPCFADPSLTVFSSMKPLISSRIWLTILLCFIWLAAECPLRSAEFEKVGTLRAPNASAWGGLRWSIAERNRFQGRPKMADDSDTASLITVAYDRYVSYYDLKQFSPRWVAYVTDRESEVVTAQKSRTGDDFARPSQFFTDGVIADACRLLGIQPTRHANFTDRVPQGLPAADLIPTSIPANDAKNFSAYIERGHLAPNNTMKCWGTKSAGQKAQIESFSLANIVPQMSAHNAPTWSALEAQCLAWAKELGSVCVVAGPIYNDLDHRRHIQDRRTGNALEIPFPDALFCVVISKRASKVSAIGFIMPHITAKYSFQTKAVPIDRIEEATGINFLSELAEPTALEKTVDQRWLDN
jgi:DNA/RNA endonuclease G (NUC1)